MNCLRDYRKKGPLNIALNTWLTAAKPGGAKVAVEKNDSPAIALRHANNAHPLTPML